LAMSALPPKADVIRVHEYTPSREPGEICAANELLEGDVGP
jgi:hypothetical protein